MMGGLEQNNVDDLVHGALDAVINVVDTGNVYATGESETMLGKARAGRSKLAAWQLMKALAVSREQGLEDCSCGVRSPAVSSRASSRATVVRTPRGGRKNSAVSSVIIGARKPSQLEDNLKAVSGVDGLARSRSPARRTAL